MYTVTIITLKKNQRFQLARIYKNYLIIVCVSGRDRSSGRAGGARVPLTAGNPMEPPQASPTNLRKKNVERRG
jgi:hypothetical protein